MAMENRRSGEIKAVLPVVREEQNSTDSSTNCILVRHLPHLEHDSSPSEVALQFFVSTLEYFIVHLTFVHGEREGRIIVVVCTVEEKKKRVRICTSEFAPTEIFTLIAFTMSFDFRIQRDTIMPRAFSRKSSVMSEFEFSLMNRSNERNFFAFVVLFSRNGFSRVFRSSRKYSSRS